MTKPMTAGEWAKIERRLEKEDQEATDKAIKAMSPKAKKEYYKNVDKFPNAPRGRYMDGMPIKRNVTQEQLRYVEKAEGQGHAVDLSSPQRAKVIAHKRHVLEDDPKLAKKKSKKRTMGGRKGKASGGSIKKSYASGGRVAKYKD
jgi:hypothetical protein